MVHGQISVAKQLWVRERDKASLAQQPCQFAILLDCMTYMIRFSCTCILGVTAHWETCFQSIWLPSICSLLQQWWKENEQWGFDESQFINWLWDTSNVWDRVISLSIIYWGKMLNIKEIEKCLMILMSLYTQQEWRQIQTHSCFLPSCYLSQLE